MALLHVCTKLKGASLFCKGVKLYRIRLIEEQGWKAKRCATRAIGLIGRT